MALVLLESLRPNPQESQTFFIDQPDQILQCYSTADLDDLLREIQKLTIRGWTAFGFLTYDAGYHFLPNLPEPPMSEMPLAWFALSKNFYQQLPGGLLPDPKPPEIKELRLNQNLESYSKALETIKDHIKRGDTYQVNYTMRYKGLYKDSSRNLYAWLRQQQRVNYAALIETPDWSVLSFSPELFFRKNGSEVTMRPMKGTAPRGKTLEEDAQIASELRTSEKERSENLMIVDMLRNDLGKICKPGSVIVSSAMEVEQYETLLQMTSTITGVLNTGLNTYDLMRATFPSGSITGAPKIRTMQIIHELEKHPRGIYTGTIGWWSAEQTVFSVAIRTLFLNHSTGDLEMGVGSGILYEANAQREYQECELKAKFLTESKPNFQLIETVRWDHENSFARLPLHLERIERSAQYFMFAFNRGELINRLVQIEKEIREKLSSARVRVLINEGGGIDIRWREIQQWMTPARVVLSETRTDSLNRFLYHKTTVRDLYDRELKQARSAGYFDVIFRNELDEITEGAISNIFVEKNGKLFTPPVNCGLLAGTFREYLLETKQGIIEERILTVEDLRNADQIYVTNSIHGMLPVTLD